MKRSILFALFVPLLALVGGCPAGDRPPPIMPNGGGDSGSEASVERVDTDGAMTPAGQACRALRAAGCPEGGPDPRTSRTCYQRVASEAELAVVPYDCLIAAKTAAAVRACGTKDTIRFRCGAP